MVESFSYSIVDYGLIHRNLAIARYDNRHRVAPRRLHHDTRICAAIRIRSRRQTPVKRRTRPLPPPRNQRVGFRADEEDVYFRRFGARDSVGTFWHAQLGYEITARDIHCRSLLIAPFCIEAVGDQGTAVGK